MMECKFYATVIVSRPDVRGTSFTLLPALPAAAAFSHFLVRKHYYQTTCSFPPPSLWYVSGTFSSFFFTSRAPVHWTFSPYNGAPSFLCSSINPPPSPLLCRAIKLRLETGSARKCIPARERARERETHRKTKRVEGCSEQYKIRLETATKETRLRKRKDAGEHTRRALGATRYMTTVRNRGVPICMPTTTMYTPPSQDPHHPVCRHSL